MTKPCQNHRQNNTQTQETATDKTMKTRQRNEKKAKPIDKGMENEANTIGKTMKTPRKHHRQNREQQGTIHKQNNGKLRQNHRQEKEKTRQPIDKPMTNQAKTTDNTKKKQAIQWSRQHPED